MNNKIVKKYAKYISETQVEEYSSPAHYSRLSADALHSLATAAGYKELVTTAAPNAYYRHRYIDSGDSIQVEWLPIDIAIARDAQKAIVRASCNAAREEAFAIYSDAEQVAAQDNSSETIAVMAQVRGVTVEQQQADIDAALSLGKVMTGALSGYFLQLEDAIKVAHDVDAIAAIVWSREAFTVIVENLLKELQS